MSPLCCTTGSGKKYLSIQSWNINGTRGYTFTKWVLASATKFVGVIYGKQNLHNLIHYIVKDIAKIPLTRNIIPIKTAISYIYWCV